MVDFQIYGPEMDFEDEGGIWQIVLGCNDGGGGMELNHLMEQWWDWRCAWMGDGLYQHLWVMNRRMCNQDHEIMGVHLQ